MGQTSGSDRNYIYKDKSERYRYMNTFYIFAVVILWVLFGVYLLAKLASKSIAVGTAVGNVVLIILFAVVELAFYLRNKSDVRLKRVVAIGVGVEFALIGMQTDAEFIYFALIAILTLQIPYYDMKRYNWFAGCGQPVPGIMCVSVIFHYVPGGQHSQDIQRSCTGFCSVRG